MKTIMETLATAGLAIAVTMATPVLAETIRIGGNFPVDHSSSLAMERFKEALSEKTGGELTAEIFPAMQLGGAKENVDQVRSGVIMGTWIGAAYLSRTVPELEAVSLPFVYPDRETAFRVIDGKVGELINEKLSEKGFLALAWMELGSRNVTNNVRPIVNIEDFEGLKIRLQPNETHLATFRAIGANPVSMGIKEVYSALQQGVLDGEENPYSIIEDSRKFNEVQKYLSDSGHFFDYIVMVVNKRAFEKLSPEHQQAVRDAMADAQTWQREKAAEEDTKARETLVKSGMEFTPISAEVRAELRQRTAIVVDQLKERIDADLVDAVLAEAQAQ